MIMEQASPAADLRYPVGRFQPPAGITAGDRALFIAEIESLPSRLRSAIAGLDDAQLDTPYREGGRHSLARGAASRNVNPSLSRHLGLLPPAGAPATSGRGQPRV